MKTHKIKTIVAVMASGMLFMAGGCDNLRESHSDLSDRMVFSVPYMSVETRSVFKNVLEEGDVFGVIGYCVPYVPGGTQFAYSGASSTWSIKRNLCPPSVFYGQPVRVLSNGCTYDYTSQDPSTTSNNPKYWYKDGYGLDGAYLPEVSGADQFLYSFFAYYPYGSFEILKPQSPTEAGPPSVRFTMPQVTSQQPLNHLDTPDAMLGVIYNQNKKTRNIQFNLFHVLTGLGFEVNNFSERELKVYSIKLSGNFYKSVDIDFSGDAATFDFPSDRYAGTYVLYDGEDNPMVLPSSPDGTSSSDIAETEHILLISGKENTFFGENVEVKIDYDFGSGRTTASYTRPGTFTPSPGIRYTAQLNFVGDAFVLQFITDNGDMWEDGENEDGDDTNDDIIFE